MIAFFNPIWIGRLEEVLWLGVSVGCLCSMGAYAPNSVSGLSRLRMLSGVGLVVTAGTILIWVSTKLFFLAILLLPAAFCFTVLIFRPTLAQKSRRLRIYLTACIAFAVLTLCASSILMVVARIA